MKSKICLALLLCCTLAALGQQPTPTTLPPPPTHHSINFVATHNEAFSVFIDGELQNRLPQGRVLVNEVSSQTHEVVVILKRPTEKAAVLMLRPGERMVTVNVNYDQRIEQLYLYTAMHNRPEADAEVVQQRDALARVKSAASESSRAAATAAAAGKNAPAPVEVKLVNDEQLDSMLVAMRGQAFDNDRVALGKVFVSSSHLTAQQISRLAAVIDFSNSQVDFLKYSYAYCLDPVNYYHTVDVLTFTSDKKKVLDYIATQR